MGYLTNYIKITNNDKNYIVANLRFKKNNVPIILDEKYYEHIKSLNKKWKLTENGYITSSHKFDENIVEINLHELVMSLYNKENSLTKKDNNIIHINKIGIDNRIENLIYDTPDKKFSKNFKKKERIIEFPKESGIIPNNIPSFMWYLKPHDTHGERFSINIGDIHWKTKSSKNLSLKYKLEEGKKYLRELKQFNPSIFENKSMNGEFNIKGKELLDSFYIIIKEAGYNNLKYISTNNLTDKYLKENLKGLTNYEIELLNNNTFF
jgi:hypothetical protein